MSSFAASDLAQAVRQLVAGAPHGSPALDAFCDITRGWPIRTVYPTGSGLRVRLRDDRIVALELGPELAIAVLGPHSFEVRGLFETDEEIAAAAAEALAEVAGGAAWM